MSVGQVLRDTGEFDEILKKGELVDDATVVRLMDKQIEFAEAEGMEVILDGYPRDKKQTEIMLNSESKFFDKINGAIILEVPKAELKKRIKERGRADDTDEVVERRFEIFEQNICSILPLLEQRNVRVEKVNGVGSFDEVTKRIIKVVQEMVPDAPVVWEDDEVDSIENDALEREKSYGE